ncbi:MAG: hypothetical protein HQK51_02925 [Oligoflexia bacterium]|nr:hypothetical protein [Oligoflexia bacterium]
MSENYYNFFLFDGNNFLLAFITNIVLLSFIPLIWKITPMSLGKKKSINFIFILCLLITVQIFTKNILLLFSLFTLMIYFIIKLINLFLSDNEIKICLTDNIAGLFFLSIFLFSYGYFFNTLDLSLAGTISINNSFFYLGTIPLVFFFIQTLNLSPFYGGIKTISSNKYAEVSFFYSSILFLAAINVFYKFSLLLSNFDSFLKLILIFGLINLIKFTMCFFAKTEIKILLQNVMGINFSWVLIILGCNFHIDSFTLIISTMSFILFQAYLYLYLKEKDLNLHISFIQLSNKNIVSMLFLIIIFINTITLPFSAIFEIKEKVRWFFYSNSAYYFESGSYLLCVLLLLEIIILYKFIDLYLIIFKKSKDLHQEKQVRGLLKRPLTKNIHSFSYSIVAIIIFAFVLLSLGVIDIWKMIFITNGKASSLQMGHYNILITELTLYLIISTTLIIIRVFNIDKSYQFFKEIEYVKNKIIYRINLLENRGFNLEKFLIKLANQTSFFIKFLLIILKNFRTFIGNIFLSLQLFFNEE